MNPAKEYVQDLTEKSLPHEYVADHGRAVDSELERVSLAGRQVTLSEDIIQAERSVIEEAVQPVSPREKACVRNALRLWEFDHRFEYAEGYAALATRPDLVIERTEGI